MSSRAKSYRSLVESKYEVNLPSGAVFLVRRPNSFWFAMNLNTLPVRAVASAHGEKAEIPDTPEERTRGTELTEKLLEECVLEPKIRKAVTAEDEISFDMLLPEDLVFLTRYLMGEVDKDGNSVDTFLKERAASNAASAG